MKFSACFFLFSLPFALAGQPDSLTLINRYGGQDADNSNAFLELSNGNIIIVGSTRSTNSFISQNNGGVDGLVLMINPIGDMIWAKNYGDQFDNSFTNVIELNNGDILLTGNRYLENYNYDIWIMKIDNQGNVLDEKTLDFSKSQYVSSVVNLANGNVLLSGGLSYNTDTADISPFDCLGVFLDGECPSDGFLLELDDDLNDIWHQNYGGVKEDAISSIYLCADGGIICVGNSQSNDLQIPDLDAWAFKIDNSHNVLWNKYYGGDLTDIFNAVLENVEGEIVVGGTTQSFNGDIIDSKGFLDVWLVKLNQTNGNLLFSRNYGGTQSDVILDLTYSENGYRLIALTGSSDGNLPIGPSLSVDTWIFDVDLVGELVQHFITRDSFADGAAKEMAFQTGNNYFINRQSLTPPNDLPDSIFSTNIFYYQIDLISNSTDFREMLPLHIYPNPASDEVWLENFANMITEVKIFDLLGREIYFKKFDCDLVSLKIEIGHLPNGIYPICATDSEGELYKNLISIQR